MAVDERSRHELYRKLETVLGPDEAATLMEHLPPVGWADVATQRDVALLREDLAQLRGSLFELEDRVMLRVEARLHQEITAQTRVMIFSLISTVLAVAGLGLLR